MYGVQQVLIHADRIEAQFQPASIHHKESLLF
jgi:hypothetical protein